MILRKLFERLGATYIKLGQFIASSPTLFPPEYVLEFEKCLDRTEPVPWEVIRATIASELGGRSLESVFSFVDTTPLASASVAQVHAAGGYHCNLQSYNVCCDASSLHAQWTVCPPISINKAVPANMSSGSLFPFVACGELVQCPGLYEVSLQHGAHDVLFVSS